jgi:hypothetical protein
MSSVVRLTDPFDVPVADSRRTIAPTINPAAAVKSAVLVMRIVNTRFRIPDW